MNDFFSSKFIQELKAGRLPTVEVTVSPEGLVQLSVAMFFTAVAIILVAKIMRNV